MNVCMTRRKNEKRDVRIEGKRKKKTTLEYMCTPVHRIKKIVHIA